MLYYKTLDFLDTRTIFPVSWFIFADSPEFSESVSYESAGAVSPEFLKKLEEWEKVKALKGKL